MGMECFVRRRVRRRFEGLVFIMRILGGLLDLWLWDEGVGEGDVFF